jgi:hypothetical protein
MKTKAQFSFIPEPERPQRKRSGTPKAERSAPITRNPHFVAFRAAAKAIGRDPDLIIETYCKRWLECMNEAANEF